MDILACRYVKGGLSRSLTVRNLQLSLYGLPFSMAYMYFKDGWGNGTNGALMQVGDPRMYCCRACFPTCSLHIFALMFLSAEHTSACSCQFLLPTGKWIPQAHVQSQGKQA